MCSSQVLYEVGVFRRLCCRAVELNWALGNETQNKSKKTTTCQTCRIWEIVAKLDLLTVFMCDVKVSNKKPYSSFHIVFGPCEFSYWFLNDTLF